MHAKFEIPQFISEIAGGSKSGIDVPG